MKIQVKNYTFDPINKIVTFSDFTDILLESVLLITNVTTNQIIYNFANPAAGGVALGNQLILDFDTTSMGAADALQIFYENDLTPVPENLVEALYDLVQSLQVLGAVRGNLGDLRVQLTAAPVTLSSVTTLSNQTSIGGYIASSQIKDLDNLLAQSNINNIQ